MTHHGRTILVLCVITAIALGIATLSNTQGLGGIAGAAVFAFLAGYLTHATEEDLP